MEVTPETPAPREYLTIAEACDQLRISRWTLMRRRRAGRIPAVKADPAVSNSQVLIPAAAVREYLNEHEQAAS